MIDVRCLTLAIASLASAWAPVAAAQGEAVTLANDEWPPFILPSGQTGKAHQLVCEALRRSGHDCQLRVQVWETVLEDAKIGAIDGIAAVWHSADREAYLLFSEPYLTNRIVPVVASESGISVDSASDLAGLRVALVSGYAYGDAVSSVADTFEAVEARGGEQALQYLSEGRADVALVDELVARDRLASDNSKQLTVLSSVLAYRSLHFAMARLSPNAETILADFHRAYEAMLLDGTVNDILEVDWLATDFGQTGTISVVMRSGISLDELANPTATGSLYALDQSELDWVDGRSEADVDVNFKVKGETFASMEDAMDNAFGRESLCHHVEYSSTFDCSFN